MSLRNCLSPGDFVVPVPPGLPVTLSYGVRGTLEHIFYNHEVSKFERASDEIRKLVLQGKYNIPLHVSLKNGLTRVRGVFFTETPVNVTSKVFDKEHIKVLESMLIKDPESFRFLAVDVESFSVALAGYSPVQQWLKVAKFDTISGFLVPSKVERGGFQSLRTKYNRAVYPSPVVAEYIEYSKSGTKIVNCLCSQMVVSSVKDRLEDDGRYVSVLSAKYNAGGTRVINLSDTVFHKIQKGSIVIFDENSQIICSQLTSKRDNARSSEIECPVCGAKYMCPSSGEVCCPVEECSSTKLPRINYFLGQLKMPLLLRTQFDTLISKNKYIRIIDILRADPYRSMKVEKTLYEVVRAFIPIQVCGQSIILKQLVNNCNNSLNMFLHYINHIDKAFEEFSIPVDAYSEGLLSWAKDTKNIDELSTILTSNDVIRIVDTNMKYEAAQIFRNTTILVSGKFVLGTRADVEALLSGYGANVVHSFDESVKVAVIGSLHDGVDSEEIRKASEHGCDVYEELEFLKEFGIDSDMKENLEYSHRGE